MKTIKQVADELGVPKQRVYRYIINHISDVHQTASGDAVVIRLDKEQEVQVKAYFLDKDTETDHISDVHHDAHQTASPDAVITGLLTQLNFLQEQLKEKDRQIAALEDITKENQKITKANQTLHGVDKSEVLLLESAEQKASRWARLKAAWRG